MDDLSVLDWVERLGGWALVTYIVILGARHVNATRVQIDQLIKTFQDAVASFRRLEKEERDIHEKIITRLDDIRNHMRMHK